MGLFLRFVLFFVLLLAAFVLVGLPLILSPVLTQIARNAGLQAQTLDVTVAPFDPTLLLGRARKVTLVASGVDLLPAQIGNVSVSVGNASYFDRTFATVSGEMNDITLEISGGDVVHIDNVTVDGPSDAASATAHLSAADTDKLIRLAAQRAGIQIDGVTVGDSGVTVEVSGVEAKARLGVIGGALVLDPGVGGAIVLLQPAPSDPWSLQEAWVSADGLNVRGVVDFTRLAKSLGDSL